MRVRTERITGPGGRALAALTLLLFTSAAGFSQPGERPARPKLGLSINDPRAFQGYTLVGPLMSTKTYLIDMQGRVVRTWESKCNPASSARLLENGNLLRPVSLQGEERSFGGGPAPGGRIQEFTWDGKLVWDFKFFNAKQLPHHDITRLPSGNVLLIVWDKKTKAEAIAAGRRSDLVGDYLLPDSLVEIKPTGKTTGEVVWEWHLWDHLIQDHDPKKANYGKVADHPELVDVNYREDILDSVARTKDGAAKLRGIGYLGAATGRFRNNPDWTHTNAVAYNPRLDQIVLSVHNFNEIWVIDHSTTTAEAASHKGGKGGKGGDLLYRWGNPRTYRAGTVKDKKLFGQHSAHWIPEGLPGAGHLLVFNNGMRRGAGNYSSVDELALPVDDKGRYAHKPGSAYGPDGPVWSYTAPKKTDFFSAFISGAERLPNGNTLVCSGANGTLFEVTARGETVWKYVNPAKASGRGPGGFGPPGGGPGRFGPPGGFGRPPQGFQILPRFLEDRLKLTDGQKKQLAEAQKTTQTKLDKLLTDEQKKQLREGRGGFRFGGGPPQPGQIMSPFQQARLKLSAEQKKQLAALQKEVDGQLDRTLEDDQKKQLKDMRAAFGRFGPGGPGGPRGPGGPGGFPGFGPPGGASVFRAHRYGVKYPGLAGKDLKPGKTIEELERKESK